MNRGISGEAKTPKFRGPRRTICRVAVAGAVFLLTACGSKQGSSTSDQPHATVLMRDGTTLTGAVTATSPAQVTLTSDDGVTHTIPTNQVKSVEYGDATANAGAPGASAPPAPAPPATASATPVSPARAEPVSRARAQSDEGHENHYHPPRTEIRTKTYVVPAGTEVPVRSEETIDSKVAAEGQTYAAEISDDVLDDSGNVVIPHGSNAQIVIRSASKGGRFRGASDLVLDLQSVTVEGQEYLVSTTDLRESGRQGVGANKRTAEYTGGGAALGAIIGAIAGGGKGAAIGLGAGAGGGALTQVLTKGAAIRVPAETVLTFKLDKAVRIVAAQ